MSVLDDATIIYVPGVYKTSAVALQKPISAGSVSSLTFARASTGTRVNSAGLIESVATNVPRVDYLNGSRGAQLLEPARTNLLTYSSYDAANPTNWTVVFGTGTFNYTLDTFRGQPALIHEQSVSGRSPIQQGVTFAAFTTYTFRMAVDTANSSGVSAGAIICGVFNLLDATGDTSATYGDIDADGFVEFTFTTGIDTSGDIRLGLGAGPATTGTLKHGMPQLEAGDYATTFIPTSASTVTRSAETLSQTGLASLLGDSEGTIYFEGSFLNTETPFVRLSISDGTTNNLVSFGTNSGSFVAVAVVGGVTLPVLTGGAVTRGENYKLAIKYSSLGIALYINGIKVDSDATSGAFPNGTLTDLRFSSSTGSASNNFYGNVKQLAIWDSALTDTELEDLTT